MIRTFIAVHPAVLAGHSVHERFVIDDARTTVAELGESLGCHGQRLCSDLASLSPVSPVLQCSALNDSIIADKGQLLADLRLHTTKGGAGFLELGAHGEWPQVRGSGTWGGVSPFPPGVGSERRLQKIFVLLLLKRCILERSERLY